MTTWTAKDVTGENERVKSYIINRQNPEGMFLFMSKFNICFEARGGTTLKVKYGSKDYEECVKAVKELENEQG